MTFAWLNPRGMMADILRPCLLGLGLVTGVSGQTLPNGIPLSSPWPPRDLVSTDRRASTVPYLEHRPKVVPIDLGRQLFVDDFLIERTSLQRRWHHPEKYSGNPILKPETELELDGGISPNAVPFSDGAFYDSQDHLYKLWYMAGWFNAEALATSVDGIHWQRPKFDVVPGTNAVLAPKDDRRRDGVTVWLDHHAQDPSERFKMFLYARYGQLGEVLTGGDGYLLTSPDGIHWSWRGKMGELGDNTGFFYNPFRKKWVFSLRTFAANSQRWRIRSYWEGDNFLDAAGGWRGYSPVVWTGADERDHPYPGIGETPQLYKVDAAPYESLLLGLFEVHYGPTNEECAEKGIPKLTELEVAFSRDGFHWDRSERSNFLAATMQKGSWERGYLSSVGGVCLVVGDKLYFYYGAFQGDEAHAMPLKGTPAEQASLKAHGPWSGMYANASTGLAILRRDGFAAMEAGADPGFLTTRPLVFHGRHLFVNTDCPHGRLQVEVEDLDGHAIGSLGSAQCVPISTDSTIQEVRWNSGHDLTAFAGRPVRFRFNLTHGSLYAFWVSPDRSGASQGYVAAGGPGFESDTDTMGAAAYRAAQVQQERAAGR